MLFNSFEFPVFFAVCLFLYWCFRKSIRQQNLLLLVASYFFYGWWDIRFLTLITLSTAIDYVCAIGIERKQIEKKDRLKSSLFLGLSFLIFLGFDWNQSSTLLNGSFTWSTFARPLSDNIIYLVGGGALIVIANAIYPAINKVPSATRRKVYAGISITSNLLILGVFKYFNFFAESLSGAWESVFNSPIGYTTTHIVLPVGISFYTFQTMSYTIDVYRGRLKPCSSFVDFAAYVSFFPQLVAGPIERAAHLIPQFRKARIFDKLQIREGLWLILWGFYKKLVVADNLAPIVNRIFNTAETNVADISGPQIAIGIYAFALQIYCDFSGYTDIARGLSKILGFDLMLNFNLPYISRSPSEFWQRWHISLSSWLRDYLYIPLGGNRGSSAATYRNLMLTMILGGLWHGASWNFVAWGFYQGGILVLYRLVSPNFDKNSYSTPAIIGQWFFMFQLTCIGWLLFRVQELSSVPKMLGRIAGNFEINPIAIEDFNSLVFYATPLICMQVWQAFTKNLTPVLTTNRFLRLNIVLFVLCSLFALSSQGGSDFIYFAF